MNQAIQFVDRVEYINGVLTFYAMANGMLIPCTIDMDNIERSDALTHFAQLRFDYEEVAQQLIEDGEFTAEGQVVIPPLAPLR